MKADDRVSRRKSLNPHAKEQKGHLNVLNRWAEFIGPTTLVKDIREDHLKSWTAHEVRRGLKLSSVSRSLNTLRAALRHAQQAREDLQTYVVPRKPVKKREADVYRERYLEPQEIQVLSTALAAENKYRDAYDFFRVALGTASRIDEILGLRWQDVDFKTQTVRLFASKTGKEKCVMVPAVISIIEARRRDKVGSDTQVFACRDHWLRKIFELVSLKCGIGYGRTSKDPVAPSWTIHDLRRTALTNLLASNVDLATVSRHWAQHQNIAETTRYLVPTKLSQKLATDASDAIVTLASA